MFAELQLQAMPPEMALLANRKAEPEPKCACFRTQQRKLRRTAKSTRELWEVVAVVVSVNSKSEKSTCYGVQIWNLNTSG